MSTSDSDATARVDSDVAYTPRGRAAQGQFAPGTVVAGRYRIASILGSGGMGEVYRADDTKLGQTVALKFLPARLERDATLLARLHDEVRLGRQIAHPNVCHLYDIVEADGAHFVAMEYVDGEDLSRLLRRIGRLAPDKAVDFARGIAAGLAAAHAKGILHRDLKPANIMIDSRGEARIMDFGLALAAGEDDGTISGTPAYMAPEQLAGEPASVQSDLYALGLVMYELFTGKRAHAARTMPERIRDITSEITTPSSHVRDMDPAVERIILRCLSLDPAQRPASAREVIQSLPGGDPLAAALAAGETPSPRIVAAAGTAGSLRPAVAWTLLAVTLACVATLLTATVRSRYWQRSGLSRPPDVQADRVSEMLRRFGLPPQPFSSYGYYENQSHAAWVVLNAPERMQTVGRGYSILRFWLREEPEPLFDSAFLHTPAPGLDDPPQRAPGSAAVVTDPRGRLLLLRAVATPAMKPRSLVWTELLEAAGLDGKTLRAATPDFVPPSFADTRAAWTGQYPEDRTPITVEAASYRGVPVYFRVRAPWDAGDFSAQLPFGDATFGMALLAVIIVAVLVGILFAWRNMRARRGDRQGAMRVAAVIFLAGFISYAFAADHELSALHELGIFTAACANALFGAVTFWLVYIAIEPFIRRRWPEGLISWARLLAGQWRDPMVGRDVLAGLASGMLHTAIASTSLNLRQLVEGNPLFPFAGADVRMFDSVLTPIGNLARSIRMGAMQGLTAAVIVMVVITVLRRRQFVGIVAFFGFFGLYLLASTNPVMVATFAILAALHTFTLLRFGLLGTAAATLVFHGYFFTAFPDAAAWYTVRGLIPTLFFVVLAAWSFRTSLGGQRAFAGSFDE